MWQSPADALAERVVWSGQLEFGHFSRECRHGRSHHASVCLRAADRRVNVAEVAHPSAAQR